MSCILQSGARIFFIAAMLVALPAGASAQGLFDVLFGRPPERSAPPASTLQPQPLPSRQAPQSGAYPPAPGNVDQPISNSSTGRGTAYCVRMCDGRYFPLERRTAATQSQLCSSLCPASPTKVYNGAEIANATTADGSRYADLKTAYLYRKTLVSDCTCNGRDVFGLATIDVKSDPTLRAGDTVATDGVTAVARPAESLAAPTRGDPRRPIDVR